MISTLVSVIVSVVVLTLLVWLIITPAPLKYIFAAAFPTIDYSPNANAKVTKDYTLYANPKSKGEKLIIVFIGGSGLYSKIENIYGFTNTLNEKLNEDYDIVTFKYPVRFTHTVLDAMLSINNTLSKFLHYKEYHAVGISFGALLAGAFYQKEHFKEASIAMRVKQIGIHFKSFSGLSGMYETSFNVELLTRMFDFYIMRNTPGKAWYTCYNMAIYKDVGLPKLAISAESDFLVAQTLKFLLTEASSSKIYKSQTLPHSFSQLIHLPEALNSIDRVIAHIKKADGL